MIKTRSASRKRMIIGSVLILSLLFAFAFFGKSVIFYLSGTVKMNASNLFGTRLFFWVSLGLLWLYCATIEKGSLLLWEEKKYPLIKVIKYVAVLFLVLFAGMMVIRLVLHLAGINSSSEELAKLVIIFKSNRWLLLFTCITAGVAEELIFRGYLLPRLALIFNSPVWAIIITSVLFGLLHAGYGTVAQIIGPIFIGAVFGYFYWKYRNIKVIILMHFLWDFVTLSILLSQS